MKAEIYMEQLYYKPCRRYVCLAIINVAKTRFVYKFKKRNLENLHNNILKNQVTTNKINIRSYKNKINAEKLCYKLASSDSYFCAFTTKNKSIT